MNKKAIAILGAIFLLIVGTLGFLVYSKYSGNDNPAPTTPPAGDPPQAPPPPDDNATTPPPAEPPANSYGSFIKLADDQVLSPALFYNGNGISYFDKSGKLFQADFDTSGVKLQLTRKRQLEIAVKPNISRILWPNSGDNFIAEFNSFGKKTWSFFDNQKGVYTDLPTQIVSLDWMPSGDKILYVWLGTNGKASLNIADPDAKNYRHISDMWETDNAVDISPDGLNILFYETESSALANKIKLTTPDGKLWRDLVKDGYNYGVLWSPDSQKFLFSKKERNSQKYQLWYYDLLTGEVKNLGLFTTVDKVVWAGDAKTVYAAVPASGSAGEGALTIDIFYKIDTATLEKKEYKGYASDLDGRDLLLNAAGDKLFFRNAQDGGLYYLDLNQ